MRRFSSPAAADVGAPWRRADTVFLLLLALWLALFAGLRPLTGPDEGRYGGVAWAMLQSGDWLVPRLNGLPFFHKPPLFYWLGATGMALFGPHEWSARLPSLLGAWLGATSLYIFLRRHGTLPQARLAAGVLCTFPFFYLGAQFANLDMLVAGCISATLLAAADAALQFERQSPWRRSLALAFLAAALGLLAKGLIGVVLPGAVFFIWVLLTRRPHVLRLAGWLPGWLLLLVVAGPWFVMMQLRYPEFFDYFVITQHFRRYAQTGFNNQRPFWFYLPVLMALCLPWTLWLLMLLRRRGRARPGPRGGVDALMAVWLVGIVAFFSLPSSKLIGYVLPVLVPLAALVARAVSRLSPAGPHRGRLLGASFGLAALLCLGGVVAAMYRAVPWDSRLRLPAGEVLRPDDRVLMLDAYYYQLPLYWRFLRPAVVAADWRPEVALARDNWRKELADAAHFEPELGRRLLQPLSVQPAALCQPGRTWVVGSVHSALFAPWVQTLPQVAANAEIAVWRHDAGPDAPTHAHCQQPPEAPASGAAAP